MAKAVKSSGNVKAARRAPLTPEARENQLISLAMDLAEQQLRDGTASSQVITEFLKRGSTRAQIEKELLERQAELASAKAESLKSAAKMEELYEKAMKAMKKYGGHAEDEDEDEYY